MIHGSCLCAEVTFEIDESKIIMMNNCHCANCRKVTGADYGTFIQISPQEKNMYQLMILHQGIIGHFAKNVVRVCRKLVTHPLLLRFQQAH